VVVREGKKENNGAEITLDIRREPRRKRTGPRKKCHSRSAVLGVPGKKRESASYFPHQAGKKKILEG